MKCKEISIKLPLFLLVFLFSSCWQKEIWDNTSQPIDDIAPALNSAVPLSNSEVEVVFSEQMDEATSENPLNYSIPGLTITNAVRDDADYSIVRLTTSSQLDIEYELTVSNIFDEYLNEIDYSKNTAIFFGDALPEVVSAAATDNTHVRVAFSEDVEQTSAEDEGNYSIFDSATNSTGIKVIAAALVTNNIVELVTESHPDAQDYDLTVIGVEDMTGNSIDSWDTIQNPDPLKKEAVFPGDALPYVSSVYPVNNTQIRIVFSEDVTNSDRLTNYTVGSLYLYTLAPVSNNIVEIVTDPQDSTTYDLKVSNIQDLTYNFIDPSLQYSFTGDALPSFESAEYAGSANILVTFSEDMLDDTSNNSPNYDDNYTLRDITTTPIDVSDLIYDAYLDSSDKKIAHISLTTDLTSGNEYELEIIATVQDSHGNSLSSPYVRQFTVP